MLKSGAFEQAVKFHLLRDITMFDWMRKSLSLWLICAAAVLALSGQVAGQKLNVVSW